MRSLAVMRAAGIGLCFNNRFDNGLLAVMQQAVGLLRRGDLRDGEHWRECGGGGGRGAG